jgi:hypothetical protein
MARRQGLVEPRVYLATNVALVALTVIGREPTPTYQLSVTSTSELASTSATSWSRAATFLVMV